MEKEDKRVESFINATEELRKDEHVSFAAFYTNIEGQYVFRRFRAVGREGINVIQAMADTVIQFYLNNPQTIGSLMDVLKRRLLVDEKEKREKEKKEKEK